MTPLRDRIVVEIDEKLPTASPIFIVPNTSSWRAPKDQISNRGRVVAVGPGKWLKRAKKRLPVDVEVGDYIKFSELQYPTVKSNDKKLVIIMNGDIVGIE